MSLSLSSYRLPISHTCFNQICLPPYRNRKELKHKLTIAISNAEGFGLEWHVQGRSLCTWTSVCPLNIECTVITKVKRKTCRKNTNPQEMNRTGRKMRNKGEINKKHEEKTGLRRGPCREQSQKRGTKNKELIRNHSLQFKTWQTNRIKQYRKYIWNKNMTTR